MYLLIPKHERKSELSMIHLHPTMYLLILCVYVNNPHISNYLHPTMYLLIPYLHHLQQIPDSYLHPTMYLLIQSNI